MRKKIIVLLPIVLMLFLLLIGCAEKSDPVNEDPSNNDDQTEQSEDFESSPSSRKIIYIVNANIDITSDFKTTISNFRDSLNNDEWFDQESISNDTAYFIARIKTARLDSFIESLSNYGTVNNLNKQGTDISLKYQNMTNQITSYEEERVRLVELYDQASMQDIIQINARISEIDRQLRVLKGELSEADSLIEYSEVQLRFNCVGPNDTVSFGQRIKNAFLNGWSGVVNLLKFLVLVVVTLFPFMIIIVPVGLGIFFTVKINKKKKSL